MEPFHLKGTQTPHAIHTTSQGEFHRQPHTQQCLFTQAVNWLWLGVNATLQSNKHNHKVRTVGMRLAFPIVFAVLQVPAILCVLKREDRSRVRR